MNEAARNDWRQRANCLDADPEIFFPDRDRQTQDAAKALCDVCPVRKECLTSELAVEAFTARSYRYGIRGGLLPKERHQLVSGSKKPPEPASPANGAAVKALLEAAQESGHTPTDVARQACMHWGTLQRLADGTQTRCQRGTLEKVRIAVERLGVAA